MGIRWGNDKYENVDVLGMGNSSYNMLIVRYLVKVILNHLVLRQCADTHPQR
jgi:hypothetical protein